MAQWGALLALLVLGISTASAATVNVQAPINGARYLPPATLSVRSVARATLDGEVLTSHRLYYDGALIAENSGLSTTNDVLSGSVTLPTGVYQFGASATTEAGQTFNSATVTITVDTPPTVSLTAPANGTTYTAPANVTLTASPADSDGSITKVEFYSGSTLLGTDTAAPYTTTWSNVPGSASAYSITARAYDNLGGVTDSAARTFTVNALPTISLDRSPSWSSIVSPAAITLTATPADSDGTIAKVTFYQGSTLVATDTAAPYTYSTSLTNGSYTFSAQAYDNRGAVVTSASNTLTVTAPGSGPGTLTRSYVYDSYQQLCKTIEPETGISVKTFDAAGNLGWTASAQALNSVDCSDVATVPANARVARSYDARNRITALSFPTGAGNQDWSYTPDGLPARIQTTNPKVAGVAVNAYTYNKRRLLVSEQTSYAGANWTFGRGYDANGSLASQTYPDALAVTYAPNALGQPARAGAYATAVSYFPNGAIQQFTYGNGIVHTLIQNTRQLPDTSRDAYGSTETLNDGYDYDADGNVAAISDGLVGARGNRTMTYDGLDRLTDTTSPMYGATGAHYTYDVLDNLKTVVAPGRNQSYVYDASNRLTNVMSGGASVIGLGYDAQGNLANNNGRLYTFDQGNRLREVSGKEWYAFDGYGRRVLSCNSSACDYQQYAYDGRPYFHRDNRNGRTYDNIYLGGSLVAERERVNATGAFTVKYQHTDALGSPVAVTDQNRNLIQRFEYEPYGKVINSTPENGPGYTGHVFDAATGLNYMQQRYYDPGIGRFLSVDPVTADGNTGSNFNRYWYANNNPYRFTDPDGRYTCSGSKDQCNMVSSALTKISDAASKLGAGSKEQKALNAVAKLYGKEGQKNGVSVKFSNKGFASTKSVATKVTITFNSTAMRNAFSNRNDGSDESVENGGTVAHEGQHGVDDRARGRGPETRAEVVSTERNAYRTGSYVNQGEGVTSAYGMWSPGMSDADRTESINKNADASVAQDCASAVCK